MSSKIRTFIRLSDRIININMIKIINIYPTQYTIEMISNSGYDGFMICGSGIINSEKIHYINILHLWTFKTPTFLFFFFCLFFFWKFYVCE